MEIRLPYGRSHHTVHLPDTIPYEMLEAAPVAQPENFEQQLSSEIEKGLDNAVRAMNKKRIRTVSVAVPDETRPVPVKAILPVLIRKVMELLPRVSDDNITILLGGGLHPPPDAEGINAILPVEDLGNAEIIAHDALRSTLAYYGRTSRQTPVYIHSRMAAADMKIVIGQIDPHQFVGFTGGAKGIVIGTGGKDTIEHNHSLLFGENASVGVLNGNPVREDLNEAGGMVGIHFAVNVVMTPDKKPAGVFAGDPDEVLTRGAALCARVYGVALDERFDMIIASCGGYPKDITLYQAQKGMNMASRALKPGGKLLLLASCEQGVGDPVYYDYASMFECMDDAMEDFRQKKFRMGLHKCYLFGCTTTRHEAVLHTELDEETIADCLLVKKNAQVALNGWIDSFHGTPRIGVVPYANTTYFYDKS